MGNHPVVGLVLSDYHFPIPLAATGLHYSQGLLTVGAILTCFGFLSGIVFHLRAMLYRGLRWKPLRSRFVKSDASWSNPIVSWLGKYGRGEHVPETWATTGNVCFIVGVLGLILGVSAFLV